MLRSVLVLLLTSAAAASEPVGVARVGDAGVRQVSVPAANSAEQPQPLLRVVAQFDDDSVTRNLASNSAVDAEISASTDAVVSTDAAGVGASGAVIVVQVQATRSPAIAAPSPSNDAIEADQIWMVSTRRLATSVGCAVTATDFDMQALTTSATLSDAFQPAPGLVTCVFIHGNRIEQNEEIDRGMLAFRALKVGECASVPLRFIIWSWPSDEVRGTLRDARSKAVRTNAEAFYLANFLSMLPESERPVRLLGYSFGARIVTGALHLVGGGTIAGYANPLGSRPEFRARVALIAAAMDNQWLLPGNFHGCALSVTEQMMLLNNSQDRALRFYHVALSGKALGFSGLRGNVSTPSAAIQQRDYHALVGKAHDMNRYLKSGPIIHALSAFLLQ